MGGRRRTTRLATDQRRQGFTLVELMIVVAIVMILAAIAIPNFYTMQLKAKRAEVPPNVAGLKDSLEAYNAAYDAYVEEVAGHPAGSAGKSPRQWTAGSNFDTIGWAPDGAVRGKYFADVAGPACTWCSYQDGGVGAVLTDASAEVCYYGVSDVDGDDDDTACFGGADDRSLRWGSPIDHY